MVRPALALRGGHAWAYVCYPGAPGEPHDSGQDAFAIRNQADWVAGCAAWRERRLLRDPAAEP